MTISLAIDIAIILLCLIIIIRSAVKGFLRAFISFSKSVLAILLAYIFCSPLGRLLSDKIFLKLSSNWVYDSFVSTSDGEGGYKLFTLFEGVPKWVMNFLEKTDISSENIQHYLTGQGVADISLVEDFSSKIGYSLSMIISKVVAFLLLFIVLEIVLAIVGHFLHKIKKIPIFNFANVILGALMGVAIAGLIAWIITMGVYGIIWFGSNYKPDVFSMDIINDSIIMEFLYEHNLWYYLRDIFNK